MLCVDLNSNCLGKTYHLGVSCCQNSKTKISVLKDLPWRRLALNKLPDHSGVWWNEVTVPRLFNLGTKWGLLVSFALQLFASKFDRWIGEWPEQKNLLHKWKILPKAANWKERQLLIRNKEAFRQHERYSVIVRMFRAEQQSLVNDPMWLVRYVSPTFLWSTSISVPNERGVI
jgi:hypothetical protein